MAMPTRGSMPRAAYATTQTLDKQKSQPSYLESANKSYEIAKDYEIPFFFLCLSESNSCIFVFSMNGNRVWPRVENILIADRKTISKLRTSFNTIKKLSQTSFILMKHISSQENF